MVADLETEKQANLASRPQNLTDSILPLHYKNLRSWPVIL